MLDSFLKFLGLKTKEKNTASKNWTWQKPKEKESTRIFLKIKNAIYKQLISEYGEQFTKEEAQYAIDHLDD